MSPRSGFSSDDEGSLTEGIRTLVLKAVASQSTQKYLFLNKKCV